MQNNQYKRLGINTLLIFIGNIGPRLASFILMPLYTFWMSKEEIGIQDIIYTYGILIVPYVSLGLYESIFIFPKGKPLKTQSIYFTNTILTICFTYLFLCLIIISLPSNLYTNLFPHPLNNYVVILLIFILLESFQRIFQSFTRGIDKMRIYSKTGIIYTIVILVFSIILIPYIKLIGYWISLFIANVISIVYTFWAIKGWRYINLHFIGSKQHIKEMLSFSLPLIPNASMWWIVNSINRPILMNNIGIDGVGLYSVAGKFPSLLNMVYAIFFSAFQISALEEYGKNSYSSFYNNIFRLLLLIQIVITIGFELFGDIIFRMFIDDKFYGAAYYLPIFCLGMIASNISAFIGISFTITKESKYFLYSAILAASIAIIGNYTLIPIYGIMGACITLLISHTTMALYRWRKSIKTVDFSNKGELIVMILLLLISVLSFYLIKKNIYKSISIILCLCITLILNKRIIIGSLKYLNKK